MQSSDRRVGTYTLLFDKEEQTRLLGRDGSVLDSEAEFVFLQEFCPKRQNADATGFFFVDRLLDRRVWLVHPTNLSIKIREF